MERIENVIIIGMGALGLLFGRQIADTLPEGALSFLMDAVRKQRHANDRYVINDKPVTLSIIAPEEITSSADLVIFAVKAPALLEARTLAATVIDSHTTIISLLNGISSEDNLAEKYPREQIIDCIAIGMDAVRAGCVLTYHNMGRLQLGINSPDQKNRLAMLEEFLKRTGVPYEICGDIRHAMWNKFMLNVGINQTCMVYETNYGGACSPGKPFDEMTAAMHEVMSLAEAEDIRLDEKDFENDISLLRSLNPEGCPSMRQDAMAGRKSEVDLFAGTVIRIAHKHGILVPVNERYFQKIVQMETIGRVSIK